MVKVSRQADRPELDAPVADTTNPFLAAPDHQQAGHRPHGVAPGEGPAAQQNFHSLVQDLEMAQFSSHELFNPYVEDFVMNADLPEFWR